MRQVRASSVVGCYRRSNVVVVVLVLVVVVVDSCAYAVRRVSV